MATGRPSKYSDKLIQSICEKIANGQSLRSICLSDEMPSVATVMRWLSEKPEFREHYARARELQADSFFDKAVEIIHGKFADNIDVQAAKVKLDAIKWTAGKLAPKKYGEYKQVDANVTSVKRLDQYTDEELSIMIGHDASSESEK